jgi:hypothetical protein
LIGFFYAFFGHDNNNTLGDNALWFFYFFGMFFGIREEEQNKPYE